MNIPLRRGFLLFLCAALLTLPACGGDSPPVQSSAPAVTSSAPAAARPDPVFYDSGYHADAAEAIPGGGVDLSAVGEGYVAVSVQDDARLKFQITKDDTTYNYDLPGDGTPTVYPLNMGSGSYTFRLMRNIADDRYAEQWSGTAEVTLDDEFQPFLRPSQQVNYSESSACVALAKELTQSCADDLEEASAVYDYVVANISYDYDKAKTVAKGYLPDPDETLSTGKGICYDYAALTAAMLRSLDIPCQLITGYVGEESLYHAWNRIYIQDQGWLTVEIKVTGDTWKRVDATFASTGTETQTLENDSNYTTRYTY